MLALQPDENVYIFQVNDLLLRVYEKYHHIIGKYALSYPSRQIIGCNQQINLFIFAIILIIALLDVT